MVTGDLRSFSFFRALAHSSTIVACTGKMSTIAHLADVVLRGCH